MKKNTTVGPAEKGRAAASLARQTSRSIEATKDAAKGAETARRAVNAARGGS